MKNMSPILLAGLIAGWSATSASAAAGGPQDTAPASTAVPADHAVAEPVGLSDANQTAGAADQGLILNLRGVTVDQALKFLSESAGFTLIRETSTSLPGTVDVVSDTPLNKDDIVALFNKVLSGHGLTVLRDGETLSVLTIDAAADNARTPVNIFSNLETLPADAEFVTEIIPVHSLNPAQVVKDLESLLPPSTLVNTSEAGNAILMTAPRSVIRRFVEILSALDTAGNGDLQVFLLCYADSKAIAQELKDVFADTRSWRSRRRGKLHFCFPGPQQQWRRRCRRRRCQLPADGNSRQRRLGRPEQRRPRQRPGGLHAGHFQPHCQAGHSARRHR